MLPQNYGSTQEVDSYMTTRINYPDRQIVQWRFGKKTCSSQPEKITQATQAAPSQDGLKLLGDKCSTIHEDESDWIGLTICECKLSYVVKLVHLPRLTIFYRQNRLPFKFHSFSPLPFCFRTPDRSNVNLLSGAAVCAVAAGRSRQKVQRKAKESRTRQAPGRKVGPKLGCCFFLGKPGKPKRLQGTRVKGTK